MLLLQSKLRLSYSLYLVKFYFLNRLKSLLFERLLNLIATLHYHFRLCDNRKSKVYLSWNSQTTTLKNIESRTLMKFSFDMLHSAVENIVHRIQCVVHREGGYVEDKEILSTVIFHSNFVLLVIYLFFKTPTNIITTS